MKKRILSMLLAIVMVVGLLPTAVFAAESAAAATRVIYVDESTFLASGYSHFYDANENLLTTTREEQEDGRVKYTMPADAKYYLTFDGHLGGGGGDNYPELPTNADTYDPFSDTWSCSHPGYAAGNCRLCGEPCPGHTYDNACDDKCNVCSEIREVGDHVYDGAEDAECNECGYVRDITPAEITGVSITVDGETYTSGNVTITPTSTITLTVTGTNLLSGTDDNRVNYADGLIDPVKSDYFEINEDGTVATYALPAGDFANSSNFEIKYYNNYTDIYNRTAVPTGIYLTYDDGSGDDNTGGEEDTTPAEITGVSITVDGVEYTTGNVTITPNSNVILTITGTNLQNGTDDHRVDYAGGIYQPVTPDYFEISEDGTVATYEPSTGDFANSSNFEITYCNNDTDTANRTVVSTGIYLTYDDGISEENRARITGMSITIDGVVYDSSNTSAEDPAVITPNTEFITITVHGTSLQNCTTDHVVSYYSGSSEPILANNLWHFEADGTGAYHYYSSASALSDFARNTTPYELQYSNNGSFNAANPAIGSGVYIVYDDSTGGEEDPTPAEITGISITVDGETYTSGNVTITPTSTVTFTITGTNLQNGTEDHRVNYALGFGLWANPDYCDVSEDGTTATFASSPGNFTDCSNYEVVYYNNYTDDINRAVVSSGIYLTYESGISEEDVARITGVSITVDGETYTSGNVTITPTSTIIYTVTGTNFANLSADNVVSYASGSIDTLHNSGWTIDTETNTATRDFSDSISWFDDCDNYEVRYSNDGDVGSAYVGTGIYLTYDDGTGGEEDTTPAEITGVSITVDGVTYTEGDVTITPDTRSIIVTVTGTHFANLSADHVLDLGPGLTIFMNTWRWETDPAANTATADFSDLNPEFGDHNRSEIMYSNDSNQNWTGTGIYLTYDDGTGGEEDTTLDSTGKILVDMQDSYGDGWNGAAIDIYKNGSLEQTVTVDETSNTVFLDYDSTATYEFKWIKGGYDYECSFTIYEDGEEKLSVTDASVYENGETIWPQGDTGGEEDTTSAEITGVSIVIDGEEYVGSDTSAENPALITSEAASVILTVHGTNLQYATDEQWVSYMSTGNCVTLDNSDWTKSEDGSLASLDLTFLTDAFTQSVSTWEIKYSNDGGGMEDAVTGLYVKYEHIAGEEDPIVITKQPTDSSAKLGDRFCVEVIAGGEGLKYQWYWRQVGTTTWYVSSQRDNTYDDVMTEARHNREVYCVITDSQGNSVTTETAILTAIKTVDLAFTKEPANVTVHYGDSFTITVEAVGEGVTYQWYYLDPGAAAWRSTNARGAAYSGKMSEKIDGRVVYCVASDLWGNQVATHSVLLSCERTELAITKQPNDASAKLGERFNVEVIAQGDGLKYQWYWRKVGAELWNVSSQRDNTYDDVMTSARHNREVYCVITDAWGNSVETDIATITGTPTTTLAITRQPESQTVTIGDMFNVTFDAQGDGLRYQWYFRPAGTEVWHTSAQKDNSYDDVMTRARHNRELYCVVTDAWGNTVATDPIVVILAAPRYELAITAQPENESVKMGEMFCVTVEAQGDELRYQWYWRNVGSEIWNVSGQRDNTYDDVMTKARHNREVKCVITDMWGNSVETEIRTITAIPDQILAILAQPTDAAAAMGENFCVTVEAQGDGLTYQWYFKNAGASKFSKSGVKDNTYDDVMTTSRAGRQVYCVITDMWGNTVTTETVTLVCS